MSFRVATTFARPPLPSTTVIAPVEESISIVRVPFAAATVCPSVKSGPHWIRTRVVNPLTGVAVAKGKAGVLAHTDLAHFNIVTTILTEDAGIETDYGFLLLGRATGAEAQGCSMAVDEFLKAAGGA